MRISKIAALWWGCKSCSMGQSACHNFALDQRKVHIQQKRIGFEHDTYQLQIDILHVSRLLGANDSASPRDQGLCCSAQNLRASKFRERGQMRERSIFDMVPDHVSGSSSTCQYYTSRLEFSHSCLDFLLHLHIYSDLKVHAGAHLPHRRWW